MKTIIILSIATIGMSTDNLFVMAGAVIVVGILTFKTLKK
jgi:hypothetical protein